MVMNNAAGVQAQPVHFGGAGESKAAFLGGHIDAIAQTYGEVKGMLNDGTVSVIAIATDERFRNFRMYPRLRKSVLTLL